MSVDDIRLGRFVMWRGLKGLVVDVQLRAGRTPRYRVQVAGGHTHWASPSELALNEERRTMNDGPNEERGTRNDEESESHPPDSSFIVPPSSFGEERAR